MTTPELFGITVIIAIIILAFIALIPLGKDQDQFKGGK